MQKTHWRKILETDFLGGVDLDDGKGGHTDVVLAIDHARSETVKDQNGTDGTCLVLHFSDKKVKPMILNVTNSKMLEKLLKSSYVEDWKGHRIQIGTEKVRAFGETHDALRIRNFLPKAETTQNHVCENCKNAIKGTEQVKLETLIAGTMKAYGQELCFTCAKKRKETAKGEYHV